MVVVLPSLAECSPGRSEARTGRQAEESVLTLESGSRSPPLILECDRIPGNRLWHTPSHPPYRGGDFVPHI